MKKYKVETSSGWCGTDETYVYEVDSPDEAQEMAWEDLTANLSVGEAEEIFEGDEDW